MIEGKIENINSVENMEHREILDGSAEVFFLGKDTRIPEIGWSLRFLQNPGDELKPENQHIISVIKQLSKEKKINTFFGPFSQSQNGLLLEDVDYIRNIDLGEGVTLKRGADVEGAILKKGEAFIVSPADCLTIVGKGDNGRILATHAGRESLFDANNPKREGIVEKIISLLGKDTKIWAGFGIRAEDFLHEKTSPTHGLINWLREYWLYKEIAHVGIKNEKIDLYEILLELFEKAGGERSNATIDKSVCTYSEVDISTGERRFFSRRLESGSNLLIVIAK